MGLVGELFSDRERQMLSQDAPTPLYFQLYSILKRAILDGTLNKGDRMPTEQELADSFSVSRITAKRAMDELAAENLVERRRGKGTHVTYEYRRQPVQAPLVGMLQEIESMARHSEVKVLECSKQLAPAHIREELGVSEGTTVVRMIRVRSQEGQPFGYYDSWTTGLGKSITKAELKKKPRLEIFREQGLILTRVTQTLSAVAASPEQAAALGTEKGVPLLSITRRSFSRDGRDGEKLVDVLHVVYRPDRFEYQMDLRLDADGKAR